MIQVETIDVDPYLIFNEKPIQVLNCQNQNSKEIHQIEESTIEEPKARRRDLGD